MALNLKPTIHKVIALLVLWQAISVGLMAVGTWPIQVAIINTALLGLFILAAKPYYSMLLLILSIPFYIIVPNDVIPNIPMWRVLFAWAFIVWLIHLMINQRQWLMRVFAIKRWQTSEPMTGARLREIVINSIKRMDSRFMAWDKVAVLFLVLTVCSLMIARFPGHGLKQILFLLNIYVFYIIVINVTTDPAKVKELIRYITYSLLIMVGLGFGQYFATMFTSPYYFWQYWALMVSSLYYGMPLANVLAYSNSWFSYSSGTQALRMFGVLPDTHAFGVICIFLLAYLTPLLKMDNWRNIGQQVRRNKWYVLAAIFLTCFGIMANGTRGVWLALVAPLLIAVLLYWHNWFKSYLRVALLTYAVIVILFLISPLISQGLNLIRTYDVKDDFLGRAGSVYDLSEKSNAGRLEIWQNSIKFAAIHPFGVGYGNFIVSVIGGNIPEKATYEKVSQTKNLRYNLPQAFITAHSLYLQLLVELGFAGLLAFILFWWEYAERLLFFLSKHLAGSRYVHLTLSLALAFVWILAYGVFDLTILNDRVLQYLFLSLAVSGLLFAKFEQFAATEDATGDIIETE